MLINDRDIAVYNAKQWRVDIGNCELKNDSEWVRGSPLPFFSGNTTGFKTVKITLIIYGSSRENIQHKISNILAELIQPARMELDGYEHRFYGIVDKYTVKEYSDQSRKRFQTLELQLSAYEYGETDPVQITDATSAEVTNPGNIVSPVILKLTPVIGMAEVTLSGICRDSNSGQDLPVTVKKLTTDQTVILDGTTGLVTESGALKAADVDMWALPALLPGENTITLSTDKINVEIQVMPLYM